MSKHHRPVIRAELIVDRGILMDLGLASGVVFEKNSISVAWALVLLVNVSVILEVSPLVSWHEGDLRLHVVGVVAFSELVNQLIIVNCHLCGPFDLRDVLGVGPVEP